ncbi:hypothetical protein ACFVAQ_25025 [Streptomyces sp. NPDC057651]|uniref:hypothetical protein n=1 Tax=unclassified Streptomyces TaxID=2593676 RepID=UPI0036B7F44F
MSRPAVAVPKGLSAPDLLCPSCPCATFFYSGTFFQIGACADRIRAVPGPVDELVMDGILDGLEAGLTDPDVVDAQLGRDVSAKAHRHAFTTW